MVVLFSGSHFLGLFKKPSSLLCSDLLGKRTILGISLDLQCCTLGPWQERRRLNEAQEIRKALQTALKRISVDAVVLAGDFNVVSTGMPLAATTNPYPPPHFALVPVETIHLDGAETWTWDGRGTPLSIECAGLFSLQPGFARTH